MLRLQILPGTVVLRPPLLLYVRVLLYRLHVFLVYYSSSAYAYICTESSVVCSIVMMTPAFFLEVELHSLSCGHEKTAANVQHVV